MKVWTVVVQADTYKGCSDHLVAGSYTSRERAVDECVKYIFGRLAHWNDLAYSMAHDESNPDAAKFFSERRKDGATVVKRGCAGKLREFLRGKLSGIGCYYVDDGRDSWHFDVDENDVEGELWHTVTWGDSDCEDTEFTTPFPETFTSEESAIENFYRYALDLKQKYGVEVPGELRSFVYDSLRKDGMCQVDLSDGCCVSCVMYHDDAKNIKE